MNRRPTIYDVARAAGVSKSLVSLVLRGSSGVSPASRVAVEKAIRTLGYRPSGAARDLAAARTNLIAVLIEDYSNPWFVELLRGATSTLTPLGYRMTVLDTSTIAPVDTAVDAVLSMRAEGIVVACEVPPALSSPLGSPALVVAGARTETGSGIDSVANDEALGARLMAEHLLSLGHRDMAFLGAAGGAAATRRDHFVAFARSRGRTVRVIDDTGPATERAGFDNAMHVLGAHPDVTAIFAANDVMAIGALGAARARGLRVPEDLAVAGYDNTALSRTRLIDLTTVDDNGFTVGQQAAELLHRRITGGGGEVAHLRLDPRVIVRGSTVISPSREHKE
jgi:DNA-binding LacI/PurR family transcriptional regulator